MLRTKLEVLLDKMHLVLDETGGELDAVDKRLLLKYNRQIRNLLEEEDSPSAVQNPTRKLETSESKESIQPETMIPPQENAREEKIETAEEEVKAELEAENKAEEKEHESSSRKSWVEPVEDEKDGGSGQSLSFLDDESENELKDEEPAKPKENADKDQYQEIYDNLEAVKKQREANRKLVEENEDEEESEEPDDSSLNDQFRQKEADLVDHLKEKPIKSLQTEIDLNDKFWFINELFEGDATTFNRLLRELDALHSFEDAKEKINEMGKIKYDWDEDNRAVDKFYRVVRRRYL